MAVTPFKYHDFPIEVAGLQPDGTFTVRVVGAAPGGEMRADEAEKAVFRPADFKGAVERLERRRLPMPDLIALGERLAGLLLPGRVRELYERSLVKLPATEGLRLRLNVGELRLAALPWEYAFVQSAKGEKVPADFLALNKRVSIVRYEASGAAPLPPAGAGPVRVVLVMANPIDTDLLDLDADARAVAEAVNVVLKDAGDAVELVLVKEATRDNLLKAVVGGVDLFHFAGHGVFDGGEPAPDGAYRYKGKILLEGPDNRADPFGSEQLAVALGNAGLRLAVLGACSSAARDEGGAWSGVAPALARQNVPAVVAMQYAVRDHNAAAFLAYLYAGVLAGRTIDEAVCAGRLAIYNRAKGEAPEWGVPVLYLRGGDGVLFPVSPAAEAGEQSPRLKVRQRAETVLGTITGMEIGDVLGGDLSVDQVFGTINQGATATGMKIGTVGEPPRVRAIVLARSAEPRCRRR